MQKEPILYVDDEEVNLVLFEAFFDDEYNVILAESAQEGLKILKDNPDIKLVISDLRMPNMDGFEFIKEIKKNYPDKICMILSAFKQEDRKEYGEVKKLIFKYLNKPLEKPFIEIILKDALATYKKAM